MADEKKPANEELTDEQANAAAGGTGFSSFSCCKCSLPACKTDGDKFYCMTHWKQTPQGKAEIQTIITR